MAEGRQGARFEQETVQADLLKPACKEYLRVEEIARAAAFLAVDAGYCTGVVLPVDGGWTL